VEPDRAVAYGFAAGFLTGLSCVLSACVKIRITVAQTGGVPVIFIIRHFPGLLERFALRRLPGTKCLVWPGMIRVI
jgi:hypothetical protein